MQATSIADHPSYFFTREEDGIRRANAMYDVEIEDFTFVPSEECVAL
ncbi:hypothetical protein KA478_03630 [Patescibacteria group bacterium]|nr:hypothetical protein [Patescibacteria group bacterium]